VPVTARLSGKFYERFGDEIANELVEWFNAVDTTYQTQLKEVNDLNWARMQARFDAFDARMDAFEARIEGRMDVFSPLCSLGPLTPAPPSAILLGCSQLNAD
jgi:hypothetical protein